MYEEVKKPNLPTGPGDDMSILATTALAVGLGAEVLEKNAVALGVNAKAKHKQSIALGSGAETTAERTLDISGSEDGKQAFDRRITGVAAGSLENEAVNYSQLKEVKTALAALELQFQELLKARA